MANIIVVVLTAAMCALTVWIFYQSGIGMAIASAALVAYGLLDFIEDCDRERTHRENQ